MNIKTSTHEDKIHFDLEGTIDEASSDELKKAFQKISQSIKYVILDFKNVKHIGSSGIGKLLLLYKEVALRGGNLKIENVPDSIYQLFKVVKLDSILSISKLQS